METPRECGSGGDRGGEGRERTGQHMLMLFSYFRNIHSYKYHRNYILKISDRTSINATPPLKTVDDKAVKEKSTNIVTRNRQQNLDFFLFSEHCFIYAELLIRGLLLYLV